MKKKVLSIILALAMLACMIPMGMVSVFARNCEDVTITNPTLWDDGSLKSMDVTFDWAPSGDEHLYVAVLDEHTESYDDWEEYWYQYDEYKHTDPSSIASSIDDFAKYRNINWYSYGGSGSTPTNGYNTINVSFNKGGVPLNVDRNYSLVMFNAPGGTGYRPTDPLGTLKCDSSTLSFENTSGQSAKVEITHTHTFSKEWTVNSTGHWHECTAEGCDIKDYSTCGLEGAAYSKHTGLTDDNTCDICGTVFYRPYDVSYTDSTITFKMDVLDSDSEPYTKLDCIRFDAFLRANNSGTAYDANMNFDENGYYNDPHFAIGKTQTPAGYCVKNGATFTVVINAASVSEIKDFNEDNPYVWLILRPGHESNCMDYGYSSVNMTYANFYDCSVCLGKFNSLEDFQNVNSAEDPLTTLINRHLNNKTVDVGGRMARQGLRNKEAGTVSESVGRTIICLTEEQLNAVENNLIIVGSDGNKQVEISVDCVYTYFYNGDTKVEAKGLTDGNGGNIVAFAIVDNDGNNGSFTGYGYYRIYADSLDDFIFDVLYAAPEKK